MKLERIMVALDFSEYSATTLGYAAALSRALGAALLMVNVINERDVETIRKIYAQYGGITGEKYIIQQQEERQALMDRLLKETSVDPGKAQRVIRVGIPWVELVESARELQADVLVMGTKGRTNVANALFGSTAEKVLRRSPVPVLSVRGKGHAAILEERGA